MCIALIDLEANVLIITAYQYTTVTSIMLLDCFSIPCVMVLSRLFLGARYQPTHLVGTAFCLLGMACIVLSDNLSADEDSAGSNPLYGDMLCLVGTSMYGASNVIQEKVVKHRDREEYLGLLGVFGAIIGSIQIGVTEAGTLDRAHWDVKNVAFIAGFLACINIMYTRASEYLKNNDAAYLNLSLLTSDVYAVIFSFFVYGYIVHWLYFVAFGLTCMGLFIYSRAPSPTTSLSGSADKASIAVILGGGARSHGAGIDGDDDAPHPPVSAFFYHSLPAQPPASTDAAASASPTPAEAEDPPPGGCGANGSTVGGGIECYMESAGPSTYQAAAVGRGV
jgi:solute carrier family 35 protein F1/2